MTCVAQLAGGDDDERLRGVGELLGRGPAGLDVGGDGDALQERQAEAQRLAGAGLGLADDVGAREGDRERHLLDGEGGDDADGLEGLGGLGEDPEICGKSWWSGCCLFCVTRREASEGGRAGPCRGRRPAHGPRRGARDHCRRSSARAAGAVPPHAVRSGARTARRAVGSEPIGPPTGHPQCQRRRDRRRVDSGGCITTVPRNHAHATGSICHVVGTSRGLDAAGARRLPAVSVAIVRCMDDA